MTLSHPQAHLPVPMEQVAEIQDMAASGRFADALLRVRKVKTLSPPNTFLVAVERQLERLLATPPDAESDDPRRRNFLEALPSLMQGVVAVLQTPHGSVHPSARSGNSLRPVTERSEKNAARAQSIEQFFRRAEEDLKRGAYGSALVEIRRVRIIAPDDQTTAEYERIIRQLVELKQRTGTGEGPGPYDADPHSDTEGNSSPSTTQAPIDPSASELHPPVDQESRHSIWRFSKFWAFFLALTVVTALAFAASTTPLS